jgi:sugar phosphate isomerase/epimerase
VYVACSTLCFGKHSLSEALRTIGELGFSKVDVAIQESGSHLRPSEVAADTAKAVQKLRAGPGLAPAAFQVELADGLPTDEFHRQLRAVCRLARVTTVPLISLPAAPAGSDLESEVERLTGLRHLIHSEGVTLTVETRGGTLTEDPAVALELCQRVPGLGLSFDPSHYLTGPYRNHNLDPLYPYIRHVRLRDSGTKPDQFQVRIGQGSVEYGRIVTQLARHHYQRLLSVDIHDQPEPSYPLQPEVRKLKFLLESLI